jgi:TRAP transporter TAXI family solute receptor
LPEFQLNIEGENMTTTLFKAVALGTTIAAGAVFADTTQDRTGWPESFTVGTASQGGTYFAYGSGWANLVAEELGLTGGAEVTGGPMQNMALVHTGEAQFGMTTMGPAAESLAGTNPIAPGLQMTNACAMFPMYQTPFSVTALSSSGITSISEIPAGARIGFGPAGSTSDTYFPRMMETLGVEFERRNGGWGDLGSQLQDGLLDVIAFAAGVPVPAVSQLEVQTDVNIIEFTEEEQAKLLEAFPVSEFEIAADIYTTLEAPARSVSMWNFAVANCDLPASFVKAAVDVVMSDNERMMNIHRAARSTLPENWDKNKVMKWHPGAAEWFKENAGADIPDDMIHSAM